MIDIAHFPRELFIAGIELSLDTRKHSGIGDLADIFWYKYRIVNQERPPVAYDCVCMSPFRITKEIREAAKVNIVEHGVSRPGTCRPNIDYRSGNIHPDKEYVKGKDRVAQLVLCRGLGPNTPKDVGTDMYLYKNRPRQLGARIHKACYFPLIEDDPQIQSDWRFIFLSKVWEQIPEGIKDT